MNTISPGIIITPLANDELQGPRGPGDPHLCQGEEIRRLDRDETVLVSMYRTRRRPQRRADVDGELRLRDYGVQFHRGGVRYEVGAYLAHSAGDHIRIADALRRPAQLERNEGIEAETKPGDETSPRWDSQRSVTFLCSTIQTPRCGLPAEPRLFPSPQSCATGYFSTSGQSGSLNRHKWCP